MKLQFVDAEGPVPTLVDRYTGCRGDTGGARTDPLARMTNRLGDVHPHAVSVAIHANAVLPAQLHDEVVNLAAGGGQFLVFPVDGQPLYAVETLLSRALNHANGFGILGRFQIFGQQFVVGLYRR